MMRKIASSGALRLRRAIGHGLGDRVQESDVRLDVGRDGTASPMRTA